MLSSAQRKLDRAELAMDREPQTKADLDVAFLAAARALDAEQSRARAQAWLGLAEVGGIRRAAGTTPSRRSIRR